MVGRSKRKREPPKIPSPQPPKSSSDPYPDFPHPTPEQCLAARDALIAHHGFPEEFSRYRKGTAALRTPEVAADGVLGETVLDGLVITLLSQNTTDSNSRRAFKSLKSTFPTWDNVLDADSNLIEAAIRCGGLARTKAARIKTILRTLKDKRGEICLEYLRKLPIDEVKAELSEFKGIGPKTVACVLMFHLQKEDFPVDTHVFRITKDIGWIPVKADREKAYHHLNQKIPDELKFDLNCLLVTHGKLCQRCSKRGGSQQPKGSYAFCPLTNYSCTTAE